MSDRSFAAIRRHYETQHDEDARLREGIGRLEFVRVQEIVRRHLSNEPARVLDVGGATGVHAEWLLRAVDLQGGQRAGSVRISDRQVCTHGGARS